MELSSLRSDIVALTTALPVIEGSGSPSTTIYVSMLRRLFDAAKIISDNRIHLFADVNPEAKCPEDGFPAWAHDPALAVMHEWRIVPAEVLGNDKGWEYALAGRMDALLDEAVTAGVLTAKERKAVRISVGEEVPR